MVLFPLPIVSSSLSTFKNLKIIFTNSTLVSFLKNYSKYDPRDGRQMLRVEITTPNHYHPLGGKTRGQG
jgi:hypothetical protein